MGSQKCYRLKWSWRVLRQLLWLCFLSLVTQIWSISAYTDPTDVAALKALADMWDTEPSSWKSGDPCDDNWVGISCSNSRVVSVQLSSLGLVGNLTGDIQYLTELRILDLSYNTGLTGSLPPSIGNLRKLVNLILVGCSFSGVIPDEIGYLQKVRILSLNSNRFTGRIPATIGNLSNVYWLDMADNRLTGSIPVSDGQTLGLDMLTNTKHFHFGMNQLSGTIPSKLFSSSMQLIHVLFDNNDLSGSLPSTLGLVKELEVVRFDRNSLTGPIPSNINNLTKVEELHLANNLFTGPLPNLTGLDALSYVDLSNNSFDASDVPTWLSNLPSLTTMYLEFLQIGGQIPTMLFSFSPLETVKFRNNSFNGTLNIGRDFSPQLELVDLRYNDIEQVTVGGGYTKELLLVGNPVCSQGQSNLAYCSLSQAPAAPYSTPLNNCVAIPCPANQNLSPNCKCGVPYNGTLQFRAPSFSDLNNDTYYHILEDELVNKFHGFQYPVDSVTLYNASRTQLNYLQMSLMIFPAGKTLFDQWDIVNIGFMLSNQTFKPNKSIFGPYVFFGQSNYPFSVDTTSGSSSSKLPLIVGVSVGAAIVALLLIALTVFGIRKKNNEKAQQQSRSFGSWDVSKNSGSAPQLKGARWFSFEELKKSTNNFSEANTIGSGGYGKGQNDPEEIRADVAQCHVYRGTLSNGQLIAIKRAEQGSMQGGLEFKTEIEMLSRVHHRNLVVLVGFCFDQGEQMLIYEYIPNGSLKESLSGKSGVRLDWKKRVRVALGTARGLAYLHELADPAIIHRDIKPSNILLDNHLNAKVSDFGLSKPMGRDRHGHVTTQVKGTMGYLDPEYYMTQQLTEKSDVYSFGVVMLELITAKKPIEKGKYIVREFRATMDSSKDLYGLHQLTDPALGIGTTLPGFEKYVDLAMKCVEESGTDRPPMGDVVRELESMLQSPGMKNNPGSGSTSVSYEDTSREHRHPYDNESLFEYSGGPPSTKIEPK